MQNKLSTRILSAEHNQTTDENNKDKGAKRNLSTDENIQDTGADNNATGGGQCKCKTFLMKIVYGCCFLSLPLFIYVVYMLQFCTSYNMYKNTVHVVT
jgi:hypothetical protein